MAPVQVILSRFNHLGRHAPSLHLLPLWTSPAHAHSHSFSHPHLEARTLLNPSPLLAHPAVVAPRRRKSMPRRARHACIPSRRKPIAKPAHLLPADTRLLRCPSRQASARHAERMKGRCCPGTLTGEWDSDESGCDSRLTGSPSHNSSQGILRRFRNQDVVL